MDSPKPIEEESTNNSEEEGKRVSVVYLLLRGCIALLLSLFFLVLVSFTLVVLAVIFSNLSISYPISVPCQCKIVSSSVDLKSAKVCELGLLNYKAKHVFYPSEKKKFRCRYDYYWASVFEVEYTDHSGHPHIAFAEAPNEALPPDCRPNFNAAWMAKDKFKDSTEQVVRLAFTGLGLGLIYMRQNLQLFVPLKKFQSGIHLFCLALKDGTGIRSRSIVCAKDVNETYDCWYTLGISKLNLYYDEFFNCQADHPSMTEMLKRYVILSTEMVMTWLSEAGRAHGRRVRWEVVFGAIIGFLTSLITIALGRMLYLLKSRVVNMSRVKAIYLVRLKRVCFLVAYFSFVSWIAIQYWGKLGLLDVFDAYK